ncbi:hypothetical protein [Terriglobus tenax]|uniref:hypothetical protein n=1 Tax=Terriglobus tenax TaxID=1111115 RepID=UPI0021DF4356|nr:hypothetical protein [Terriglobus tenax]
MNVFRGFLCTLASAALLLCSPLALAQATKSGLSEQKFSRIDIYAGYGYLKPINTSINGQTFNSIYNKNMTISVTGYLTQHWGIQGEVGYFSADSPRGAFGQCIGGACSSRDQSNYTLQGGPVYRVRLGHLSPFAHVLGGGSRTRGPFLQPLTWGYGVTAGGGVDYIFRFWNETFALRPIQADFQYSHVNYGATPTPAAANYTGILNMPAIKLSGGLVMRLGNVETPLAVSEACEVEPSQVYPGDPIRIEPATVNLNPKKKTTYTWTTTGGQLTVAGDGANLDTANLAPGTYTVKGHLTQGGKSYQQADCSRDFTVRPYDPPTVSCSASPGSVKIGESVTVSASGRSPQNRPLSYTFTSTSGQLTGQGSTRTLQAGGTPATITVNCTVVDDQGKTASATTTVSVTAPPPPPLPSSRNLCSVSFARDRRRPVRVDNEAKACLDEIALVMAREGDAKLVLLGNYDTGESAETGAERSLNVSLYLKQDKGIDPSRIETRIGSQMGRGVDSILLPPGATNPAVGSRSFDPATIRSHGEAYGRKRTATPTRKRRRRK